MWMPTSHVSGHALPAGSYRTTTLAGGNTPATVANRHQTFGNLMPEQHAALHQRMTTALHQVPHRAPGQSTVQRTHMKADFYGYYSVKDWLLAEIGDAALSKCHGIDFKDLTGSGTTSQPVSLGKHGSATPTTVQDGLLSTTSSNCSSTSSLDSLALSLTSSEADTVTLIQPPKLLPAAVTLEAVPLLTTPEKRLPTPAPALFRDPVASLLHPHGAHNAGSTAAAQALQAAAAAAAAATAAKFPQKGIHLLANAALHLEAKLAAEAAAEAVAAAALKREEYASEAVKTAAEVKALCDVRGQGLNARQAAAAMQHAATSKRRRLCDVLKCTESEERSS